MSGLVKNCGLCGKELKYNENNKKAIAQKLPTTQFTDDPDAKSEAHLTHYAGKRSRGVFKRSPGELQRMGFDDEKSVMIMCYECHEVVLHNPIFNKSQIKTLKPLFKDKTCGEKIVVLNRVIDAGIKALSKEHNTKLMN